MRLQFIRSLVRCFKGCLLTTLSLIQMRFSLRGLFSVSMLLGLWELV